MAVNYGNSFDGRGYEIVQGTSAVTGDPWWSVIAHEPDGTLLGGDAHWVREEFAKAAREMYEQGDLPHGDSFVRTLVVERARVNGWNGQ